MVEEQPVRNFAMQSKFHLHLLTAEPAFHCYFYVRFQFPLCPIQNLAPWALKWTWRFVQCFSSITSRLTFERFRQVMSHLSRHCRYRTVLLGRWTLALCVDVLPIGQHLPAEAESRQHHVTPALPLAAIKGWVDVFLQFLDAVMRTELTTGLSGLGLVSFDHVTQRRGHSAGRHQDLATVPAHGCGWVTTSSLGELAYGSVATK